MDEPAGQASWFTWLLGIVLGIFGWVGEIYRRRVDEHEKYHVTRDELKAIIKQGREDAQKDRDDVKQKHVENTTRLERIEDRVNQIVPPTKRRRT